MDMEEEEKKMVKADEEEELGTEKEVEGEDLVCGSLIRSRPGGHVHIRSLHWMTSLWRKTV